MKNKSISNKSIPTLTIGQHSFRYIQVPYDNRYYVCRYTYQLEDGSDGMFVDYAKVPKGLPESVITNIINASIKDDSEATRDRIDAFFAKVEARDIYLDQDDETSPSPKKARRRKL